MDGVEPAGDHLEVTYGAGTSKNKDVLASSDVMRSTALATTGIGLAVFDRDPLAEFASTSRGSGTFPELLLEGLVRGNGDLATSAWTGVGALGAERTSATGLRWKLDGRVGHEALPFTGRTGDGAVSHVDGEGALGGRACRFLRG
jgi:hypothetical protein